MPKKKILRDMDPIDQKIVELLLRDGRMPNQAIADAVNVAPSTAHHHIAALVSSGVIKGFHAEVDLAAVGRPILAVILVQVRSSSRARLQPEIDRLSNLPGVLGVCLLASLFDLMLLVAMPHPAALSDFVVRELNQHQEIASTQTCLIMSHRCGGHGLDPAPGP